VLFSKHYKGHRIKKDDEMAGACNTHCRAYKCVQKLGWKTCHLRRQSKLAYLLGILMNIYREEMYGTDVTSILKVQLTS
jgi:hypothetical protein